MNVFIVDDDEIIRKGIRTIIEKSDINCTVIDEASDGELALKKLEQCDKVDLLITDIRMPIMDGIELIRQIKERSLPMKIIVLSGYDEFKYVRNAFLDGAVDYILKPINKNEFIEILKKIQTTIEQDAEKQDYLRESHQLLVANTLNHLFHVPIKDHEEELKNLNKIGLYINETYYFVMICRIDNFYKQKMERMEYEGALDKICEQINQNISLSNPPYQIWQYINKSEIVYFINSPKEINKSQVAEDLYNEICKIDIKDTTYTLGVGNIYYGLQNATQAYKEAEDSAEARFYLGHNHLIEYNEISNKMIDMNYDLEPHINKLVPYIELYDYINCRKIIDIIFLDLSYMRASKFRKYMKELIDQLNLRVKDFEEAILCCALDYMFYLENINTYNELKSYMSSLIKDVIAFIKNERDKRSRMRIELAKKYIVEHYSENITLNDIADHIELNASYFSNLFKTEVGINFSDYLLDVRMQMARKLLRNPMIKVYEIGCMVGYEDAVSFGRAFKKKVGMSPKEYRNTVY